MLMLRSAGGFSIHELYPPSSPSPSSLPSTPRNTIPTSSFEVSLPAHLKSRVTTGHNTAAKKNNPETSSRPISSEQSFTRSDLHDDNRSSPPLERNCTESSQKQESRIVPETGKSRDTSEELGHLSGMSDSSYQETPPTSSFPSPSPSPQSTCANKVSQPCFGSPGHPSPDLFITPTSSPYPSPPPSPQLPTARTYETFFSKAPHK